MQMQMQTSNLCYIMTKMCHILHSSILQYNIILIVNVTLKVMIRYK